MEPKFLGKYIYPYGRFCGFNGESYSTETFMVYQDLRHQSIKIPINSLEGIFSTNHPLSKNELCSQGNMKQFEVDHQGKFYELSSI